MFMWLTDVKQTSVSDTHYTNWKT